MIDRYEGGTSPSRGLVTTIYSNIMIYRFEGGGPSPQKLAGFTGMKGGWSPQEWA